MAATDVPGLAHKIYVGGRILARTPNPLQLAPRRWEARVRLSNMGIRVDRGLIDIGYPKVIEKTDLLVPYSNVGESELLEHLLTLAAIGSAFDVCTFKQHKDVFDGDASRTEFVLQKRLGLPTIETFEPGVEAANANAGFATRVERYSYPYGSAPYLSIAATYTVVYKTEAEIAGGTPSSGEAWISKDGFTIGNSLSMAASMKVNPAPGSVDDSLIVTYIPMYRMIIESDAGRTFPEAMIEGRSLKLTEV